MVPKNAKNADILQNAQKMNTEENSKTNLTQF